MMSFQKVSFDSVPKIVDILKVEYPEAVVPCQMLQMYKLCAEVSPERDIWLFTPGGEVNRFGTFLLRIPDHRGTIIFHTLDTDMETLTEQIINLNIDWSEKPYIGPVHDRYNVVIKGLMKKCGLEILDPVNPADNYMIPLQTALALTYKIPEEVELRPITLQHAGFINDRWPHRGPKTLAYIEDVIKTKGGIALFLKASNEMVSWCLYSLVGGVGMIKTAEGHCGKGYGETIARIMTKIVAETGNEPHVQIRVGLDKSVRMFSRIGYQYTHLVHWHQLGPRTQ